MLLCVVFWVWLVFTGVSWPRSLTQMNLFISFLRHAKVKMSNYHGRMMREDRSSNWKNTSIKQSSCISRIRRLTHSISSPMLQTMLSERPYTNQSVTNFDQWHLSVYFSACLLCIWPRTFSRLSCSSALQVSNWGSYCHRFHRPQTSSKCFLQSDSTEVWSSTTPPVLYFGIRLLIWVQPWFWKYCGRCTFSCWNGSNDMFIGLDASILVHT